MFCAVVDNIESLVLQAWAPGGPATATCPEHAGRQPSRPLIHQLATHSRTGNRGAEHRTIMTKSSIFDKTYPKQSRQKWKHMLNSSGCLLFL
eukprot:6137334-Amphidinium_carterae.1